MLWVRWGSGLVGLEVVLDLCEVFVGLFYLGFQTLLIVSEALGYRLVGECQHLDSEDGCILCPIHSYGG